MRAQGWVGMPGPAGGGVGAGAGTVLAFAGLLSDAGFAGADLRGIIPSSRLRLRAATSSLVVVSGFNCAGSFQAVSFPGAAPLSTYPARISRNACSRSLVRYSLSLGCMRGM